LSIERSLDLLHYTYPRRNMILMITNSRAREVGA
jgi:hypothetical protein